MMDALLRLLMREEVDAPEAVPPGVSIRRGRFVPTLGGVVAGMGRPAAAVTLGRTIIVHPAVRPTRCLIRHEMAHVRQWRRHPVSFPFRYLWEHVRHGYHENRFEVEARDAEHDQSSAGRRS